MRLKFILCFIYFLNISLNLLAQTEQKTLYSFFCENKPIAEAIQSLSEQTKVPIAFSATVFDANQRITKRFEKQDIETILQSILKETGIGFSRTASGFALFVLPPREWTISGTITDFESGEPLSWAVVSLIGQKIGTIANDFGFFSLKVKEEKTLQLQVRYLGFTAQIVSVAALSNQKLSIQLKPTANLPEIVVASPSGHLNPFETPSSASIPTAWMRSVTTTMGEPDVQRNIAMLPGVVTGADGVGGLHIRGGNADQNLTLFDGMPLYNASHAGGFFSIVNPLLVKSARLLKGATPARYAGRLSSVLDIQSREGNENRWGAEVSMSPVSINALIEGPLGKRGGAILLAARQSLVSPWFDKLGKKYQKGAGREGIPISQSSKYDFRDLNARWHLRLNTRHQIYASAYLGYDDLDDNQADSTREDELIYLTNRTKYQFNWGNNSANIRWNWIPNDHWFGNTSLTYSKFTNFNRYLEDLEINFDTIIPNVPFLEKYTLEAGFTTGIESTTFRSDWDWLQGGNWRGKIGAGASKHRFLLFDLDGLELDASLEDGLEPGEPIEFESDSIIYDFKERSNAYEGFTFAEMEWQKKALVVNFGLHLAAFRRNKLFVVPQPRLQMAYKLSKNTSFEASVTKQAQFIQLLTINDMGFPNDFWTPISNEQGPQVAWQTTLGISQRITNSVSLHVEAYHKKMSRLAEFDFKSIEEAFLNSDDDDSLSVDWERNAIFNIGKATGLEFLLEKRAGRFTALASYTLSKATRNHFPTRPIFRFDARHNVVLGGLLQFNKHWRLSGRWQYFTGLPINLISQEGGPFNLFFLKYFKSDLLSPEIKRIPDFHRLDLSVGYHTKSKRFEHDFSIGLHNVYNRRNVTFAYERVSESIDPDTIQAQRALPILPSLRWLVKVF
jgi:hypothetical protein